MDIPVTLLDIDGNVARVGSLPQAAFANVSVVTYNGRTYTHQGGRHAVFAEQKHSAILSIPITWGTEVEPVVPRKKWEA